MKWICEKCGINIEACERWRCTDQEQHKWIKLSHHGFTGQPPSHQWIELALMTRCSVCGIRKK